MDLNQATAELDRIRSGGTLADLQALVNEARPALAGVRQADATEFMLRVCDMLESRDFGDYEGQPPLLFLYADETLASPGIDIVQQFRLLAHLEQDFPTERPDWAELRERRSQAWLQALIQAKDLAGPVPAGTPLLSVPVPGAVNLPHGVSPEVITDDATRAQYEDALNRNLELSRKIAQHHRMRQLLEEYQPRASTYIARAFTQPPQDLQRMQQLFGQIGSLAWGTGGNPGPPA